MESDIYDREHGIQAIIPLQAFAGINESPEKAAREWDLMSAWSRKSTTEAHKFICGGFPTKAT